MARARHRTPARWWQRCNGLTSCCAKAKGCNRYGWVAALKGIIPNGCLDSRQPKNTQIGVGRISEAPSDNKQKQKKFNQAEK